MEIKMFNKKPPIKKTYNPTKDAGKRSSLLYEKDHIYDIDISLVIPNPMQPRKNFDDVALAALADSIKKHGLLQPISVRMIRKSNGSAYFELIAGERRLRIHAVVVGLGSV